MLRRIRELMEQGRSIGEIAAVGRRALLADAARPSPSPSQPRSQAGVQSARSKPPLGWALDGSGEPASTRALHAAAQAAARLSSRLESVQLLPLVVETLVVDFASALARIWVFDPVENALFLRASDGLSRQTTTSSRARIDLARYRYKVGVVARSREAFISNAIVGDLEFEQRWVKRERLASVIILPLVSGGTLQGVLASFFRVAISEEVVTALGTLATMTASSIAVDRAKARAERLTA